MTGSQHDVDRRRFLAGATAAGVVTAVTFEALPSQASWSSASFGSVVVHDPRIILSEQILQQLGATGARIITLTDDPVRLWRSETGAPLRDPSTTLLGVSGWSEFLLLRGMAAETRRHMRYATFDRFVGSFLWLIR